MSSDFQFEGQPYEAPVAAADQTYATAPPTMGRAMGALFGESSSSEMLERAGERGAYEGSGIFDRMLYQSGAAQAGVDPTPIKTPTLSPDEYNRKYAPIGPDGKQVSLGDKPMPEGIAQLVGKAKSDEIEREGVLSRFSNAHSAPVTFGAGMAAFMLDPLNAATTFLPGIGEETALAGLGRVGVTGIAARVGARVIAGGTAGAVAQAPVSALRYGLGTEEASDYGLRDAFRDMMFSAAGNAVVHAGFGTAGDLLRGGRAAPIEGSARQSLAPDASPILSADAPTKADAMRAGVSQIADGREVDVDPFFGSRAVGRPEDVIDFLQSKGGVQDQGGELSAQDLNRVQKGRFGMLVNQRGLTLDYAREAAEEAGFIPRDSTINDLLDAIHETAAGNPRFRPEDSVDWLSHQAERRNYSEDRDPYDPTNLFADLADEQSHIYHDGFSPGISQPEFDQLHSDIYGAREPEETVEQPKAEGEPQTETDKQLADAEAQFQASQRNGIEVHPEDQAELQRTQQGVQAADAKEQAFGEAASCLGGGIE